MRRLRHIPLLAALGAGLALGGCGGDDESTPIPDETAAALQRQLDSVEARLDEGSFGACQDVFGHPTDPNQPRVQELLASIPQDVDADLRNALERSFSRLWELVEEECEERQPDPVETAPAPDPTATETETEEEEPPPTETTPPEEEELPPEGDGDSNGLIPEGDGGGGVGPGEGD